MKNFVKDPQAILDYNVDWTLWLDGDTISTSTWVVESPLVIEPGSEDVVGGLTTVFISGGEAGSSYNLTNSITSVNGRANDRTLKIIVRER